MANSAPEIREVILQLVGTAPEGHVFQVDDFLSGLEGASTSGQRISIRAALTGLVAEGALISIGSDLYVRPVEGRFGKRPPALDLILASIEEREGHPIVCSGAAAANALGLSTQVPARPHYLTTGKKRRITLGRLEVTILRAEAWQVALGDTRPGLLIRALAVMGEERSELYPSLRDPFTDQEWRLVGQVAKDLPEWMPLCIDRLGQRRQNVTSGSAP